MNGNIICPNCGMSYYMEEYTTTTAVYYPPIWKDGININPDRNSSTTKCKCMNCGASFGYRRCLDELEIFKYEDN